MASQPTPTWVKGFVAVLVAIVVIIILLHVFGLAPHMHHMMP